MNGLFDNNDIQWEKKCCLNSVNKKRKHVQKQKKDDTSGEVNDDTKENDNDEEEDNNCGKNASKIYSHENHVYFYSDVNKDTITTLQREMRTTVARLKTKMRATKNCGLRAEYEPIYVHIYSPGGGIFAAFLFIDFLTQMKHQYPKLKFHSVVEGSTASAGTLMSVVFDKRYITEYGYMLIHQLNSGTWGKYNEIKDEVKNLDTLMDRIKSIYKIHCNFPSKKLNDILKHDIYWDKDKCIDYGLVDEVITSSDPITKE